MSLKRRGVGGIFWYRFKYAGQEFRGTTGTPDLNTARKVENKVRADLHGQDKLGDLPPMTLGEAVKEYFMVQVKPTSVNNLQRSTVWAKGCLAGIVEFFGKDTLISTIATGPEITRFKNWLVKPDPDGPGNAPNTADRKLGMLRAVLRKAIEWGNLATVPEFKLYNMDDSRVRWLTADEEAKLLAACNPELLDVVIFLTDAGCRLSTALQVQWIHIHLKDESGKSFVQFQGEKGHKEKGSKPRSVPLTPRNEAMLRRRWEASAKDRRAVVFAYDAETKLTIKSRAGGRGGVRKRCRPALGKFYGLYHVKARDEWNANIKIENTLKHLGVFKTMEAAAAVRQAAELEYWGPDTEMGFETAWDIALAISKIPDLHVHDLRHTFASRLAMAGINLRQIQEWLGHASIEQTEIYAHLMPSDSVDAAGIAALVNASPGPHLIPK